VNQTCSFRGSKSRNKVWISKINDLSAPLISKVRGSFAEALAAIVKSYILALVPRATDK
jgi:hypothetical protein